MRLRRVRRVDWLLVLLGLTVGVSLAEGVGELLGVELTPFPLLPPLGTGMFRGGVEPVDGITDSGKVPGVPDSGEDVGEIDGMPDAGKDVGEIEGTTDSGKDDGAVDGSEAN
jgi:hypothetical protein